MILQYYPDGSLQVWIQKNEFGREIIFKVSKEISSALRIMHSFYLAHCDIKTQNVLIEVTEGVPACYLTDFGITQVLSDKILASSDFNIINLRGLSVFYAARKRSNALGRKHILELTSRSLIAIRWHILFLSCSLESRHGTEK
jgi:serine/threonine protein kinase